MVGIDRDPRIMDLHVVVGYGCSVLEAGIPVGRDFNRFVAEVPELGVRNRSQQGKKE